MRKPRRYYRPEEKLAIVRRHLLDRTPILGLCDECQLSSTVYYRWQKQLFANGAIAFYLFNGRSSWHPTDLHNEIRLLRRENHHLKKLVHTMSKYETLKIGLEIQLDQKRQPYQRLAAAHKDRILAMTRESPFGVARTLERLGVPSSTYYAWRRRLQTRGKAGLENHKPDGIRKAENDNLRNAVFSVLHSPPSDHGINRTTWRLVDLRQILNRQGNHMSIHVIREIIRAAGYKYRRAKVVLTSKDPKYREKLGRIHEILSKLRTDERFFSIDEYGPFAIKMKPGRRLVPPNETPKVPQWQKSKGCLIVTAALELSTNRVTHLYAHRKDTSEMIRMLNVLLVKYKRCRKLYLSWDAASWHASAELCERVKTVNSRKHRSKHRTPIVELAPLPAGAQFLNVIESIFSGLAKAVIHNSDYQSVDQARGAIDRHFRERNEFFRRNPKRAGKKIWGNELVECEFSEGQNCKDPRWR